MPRNTIDLSECPGTPPDPTKVLEVSTNVVQLIEMVNEHAAALDGIDDGVGGYNVTSSEYGADPTGATDSTAAIQAAIDAAHDAGGGMVFLPNGTYVVSRQEASPAQCLYLKTGVSIVGESLGAVLKLEDDADDAARVIVTYRAPLSVPPVLYSIEAVDLHEVSTRAVTREAHGLETGDGPIVFDKGVEATSPDGVELSTNYWVIKYDDDHFFIAESYDDALLGKFVAIGDDGDGLISYQEGSDCVRPSTDMNLRNFSIDGNKDNNNIQEHRHGIFVYQAARMVFENLDIRNCTGDGIAFSGGHDCVVQHVHAHDCERTGVDFIGFGSHRVTTRNCALEGNRDGYHIELSDLVECTDIVVENVTCGPPRAGAEYGLSISSPVTRFTARNCTVDAPLSLQEVADGLIDNCTMNQYTDSLIPPLEVGNSERITIRNCVMNHQGTPSSTRWSVSVQNCDHVAFVDSHLVQDSTNCVGVTVIDSENVTWRGGSIECTVAANALTAINVFTVDEDFLPVMHGVRFEGVHIENWSVAGFFDIDTNGGDIEDVHLVNNRLTPSSNTPRGWSFDAANITDVVAYGNTSSDPAIEWWPSYPSTPILIGGDLGGQGVFSCDGDPESVITAPVGSLALRRDGGASTTLYVKTSGTGNTGWTAK